MGVVAGLIGIIGAPLIFPGSAPSTSGIVAVGIGLCAATGMIWLNDCSALLGTGRVGAYATVLLIPSIFMALGVTALFFSDRVSVNSVVIVQALSYPATCCVSMLLLKAPFRGKITSPRELVRDARPFAGAQISEALSYRLDQVLVLGVIGAHGSGLYSIATTIAMLPSVIGLAVASASFKRIAIEASNRGAVDGRWVRVALIAVTPVIALLALICPLMIPIIFGDQFSEATVPTLIGLLGCLPLAALQISGSMLVALGRGWRVSIAQLAGLICGVVLLYLLGPRFGPSGAAAASSLGFTIGAIIAVSGADGRLADLLPRRGDVSRTLAMFGRGAA